MTQLYAALVLGFWSFDLTLDLLKLDLISFFVNALNTYTPSFIILVFISRTALLFI